MADSTKNGDRGPKKAHGAGRGQTWLAGQVGVSQPRISDLVREGRCPRKAEYTDADAATLKSHLSESRAGNNATVAAIEESDNESEIQKLSRNPERVARIRLIVERTAKIKLERELLAGGYIKREDVEKERLARVYSVRAKLQELPLRSFLIAHKSEAECERILMDWMREVCTFYAEGGS